MRELYQFKVSYDRDIQHNYIVLKTNNKNFDENNYQLQMLTHNTIEGCIAIDVRGHNEDVELYYDITSKQPLSELLSKKEITTEQIKKLLKKIICTLENSRKFLLKEDNYIINKDYIFIEPYNWEVFLCYIPEVRNPRNLADQMKDLIEYLMDNTSQEEKEAIILIHKLYKITKKGNFTIGDLENIIKENHFQDETPRKSLDLQQAQEVKDIEEINKVNKTPSENSKSTPLNMPIKKEKVTEEKEVKIFPFTIKVITGIIQVALCILIYLCISSEVFVNEATRKLDITKLVAFVVILLVIDGYVLSKLFNEKNKIIKLIEEEREIPIQPEISNQYLNLNKRTLQSVEESNDITINNKEKVQDDNFEGTTLLQEQEEIATTLLTDNEEDLAYLVANKNGVEEEICINNTPFIIGKLSSQVDYVIDNPTISRIHAKIIQNSNEYYLIDLNSRNGTFINGKRINNGGKELIRVGDIIKFSDRTYTFKK
ncbi:MAG: DUF6382 domain-containing protein [Eubacteriales bacterium]